MTVTIEKKKVVNSGKLIAFVDVCIDGWFVVRGCKIIAANNGRFVGLPSENKDGKYYDHIAFTSRKFRDEFSHLVISAYDGNSGSSERQENTGHQEPQAQGAGQINWEE